MIEKPRNLRQKQRNTGAYRSCVGAEDGEKRLLQPRKGYGKTGSACKRIDGSGAESDMLTLTSRFASMLVRDTLQSAEVDSLDSFGRPTGTTKLLRTRYLRCREI